MFHCPNCESKNYHVYPGYGADCDDCGFAKDAKGRVVDDDKVEKDSLNKMEGK